MISVFEIALPIAALGALGGVLISIGLHWGTPQSWAERGILAGRDALLGGTILFIILLSLWLWMELLTAGAALLSSTASAYLTVHVVSAGALTPVFRFLDRGPEERTLPLPISFFISLLASPLVLLIGLVLALTYLDSET